MDPETLLMAAAVTRDEAGEFRSATPEALFEVGTTDYEPAPGGQRFLVVKASGVSEPMTATVVLNWPALLQDQD